MTTKELNRDIKRLTTKVITSDHSNTENYYKVVEEEIKPEIKRLFYADHTLKSINADSLRNLLRLNLMFRAIPLHVFGLHIELQ